MLFLSFSFFLFFFFSPSKPDLLKAFGYARKCFARKCFASDKPGIFKMVPVLLQCLQLRPILLTKHRDGISPEEAIKASPWQGCACCMNVYILNPCLHGHRRGCNSSEETWSLTSCCLHRALLLEGLCSVCNVKEQTAMKYVKNRNNFPSNTMCSL